MDTSRRAVESYWRSRLIDSVTADDDKIAPVYKLDEICDLLRSSHPSIVKELADLALRRLSHSSPYVKQKALRLIKYAVPKSGNEFRREMQRHSSAIRPLVHYKGDPDPLKGDAVNKSVRETAQAAVAAVFAADDAPAERLSRRIEGFGNMNYSGAAVEEREKKSFLSEMVDLGKQGLSTIAAAHMGGKADGGSYKSPTLRRSLTNEGSGSGRGYERESWVSEEVAKNAGSSGWSPDLRSGGGGAAVSEDGGSRDTGVKSREERLLETIVTSGGVRLQPTRESLQAFLIEASKLDALAMSHAIELKLNSHLWQVRMKAICVLESILRKKDEEYFFIIASYFGENRDSVVKCSELPHVSLREKASKVLILLDGDQNSGIKRQAEEPSDAKQMPVSVVQMPDLIDTGDPDEYESEASYNKHAEQRSEKLTSTGSLVDDLFGSDPIDGQNTNPDNDEHDPFADVSFHITKDKEQEDIFSGLTIDDKISDVEFIAPATKRSEVLDIFGGNSEQLIHGKGTDDRNMHDLMSGLALNGKTQENKQPGSSGSAFIGTTILDGSTQQSGLPTNGALNGLLGSSNLYPVAPMQYSMPPNVMLNQAFSTQPMNYAAMSALIAQQQLLLQNFGNLNGGFGHPTGIANEGGHSSLIPDIFQLPSNQVHSQGPMMTITKKEETRAFDFIADHLSAARDPKRML